MDNRNKDTQTESPVPQQPPKKATITVRSLGEREGYCVCVTAKGDGYLVPSALCPVELHTDFELNPDSKGVVVLYNWNDELDAAIPSREKVIANARQALWLNGAYSPDKAKLPQVQRHLMRGTFPYRIEIKEEK